MLRAQRGGAKLFLFLWLSVAVLLGCGSDGGDKAGTGGVGASGAAGAAGSAGYAGAAGSGATAGSSGAAGTAGSSGSSGNAGAAGSGPVCTFEGFTPIEQLAGFDTTDGASGYIARDMAGDPTALLIVYFGTADGPFSHDFTGDVAAGIDQGCTGVDDLWLPLTATVPDCERHYGAIEGTLHLTTYEESEGGTMAGSIEGAVFVEMEQGQPVPGGDRWCVDSMAFSALVRQWP